MHDDVCVTHLLFPSFVFISKINFKNTRGMGFSSEWVSIMKGVVREAFTVEKNTPNLRGAFIDGQIQLMKSQFVTTMDMFYRIQFANIINKYLKEGTDDMVVVLAFDDYNNVPASKSMTQMRRKQRVVDALLFTEQDTIPTGNCPPNWDGAMCNRAFKTKLIRKITEVMGGMITLRGQQRVIVDFIGDPIEYSTKPGGSTIVGSDSPCYGRYMTGFAPVGEADCKMPRWVDYISSLHPNRAVDVVVEATDSDYILIAMLHYEKQSQYVSMDGAGLGRVILRRIKCKDKEAPVPKAAKKPTVRPKREMEYVHVPLLCEVMSKLMVELFDGGTPMQCLTAIVALGGKPSIVCNFLRMFVENVS